MKSVFGCVWAAKDCARAESVAEAWSLLVNSCSASARDDWWNTWRQFWQISKWVTVSWLCIHTYIKRIYKAPIKASVCTSTQSDMEWHSLIVTWHFHSIGFWNAVCVFYCFWSSTLVGVFLHTIMFSVLRLFRAAENVIFLHLWWRALCFKLFRARRVVQALSYSCWDGQHLTPQIPNALIDCNNTRHKRRTYVFVGS